MSYEEIKKIFTDTKKFYSADGASWQFNDTSISIDNTFVTHYLLYVEHDTGAIVIMTTHPLEVSEDYMVTVEGYPQMPITLVLTPRISKHKVLMLRQEKI